ncbi:MAG: hypothetical protein HZB38_13785, partial [Planctomycetes bacterium]|nr:hypothetical protein [Planctomycetota bacterium]
MQEAVDLIRDAHTLALQAINDVSADDERRSLASVASSSLDRLITVANRKYLDTYLFSGRYGDGQPFEMQNDGVLYHGDDGKLQTAVENDYSWETFTVPGSSFFSAVSSGVQGWADLNPSLTADTLISDLAGATGTGVSLGRITVAQGAAATEIDLSGAVTVGDIIDRLNAEMPPPLQAMLTSTGINIAPSGGPGDVMITDANGGRTAVDLGIFSSTRAALVAGADLNPRLTGATTLAQLNGGAGLNLAGGITIRNGDRSAIVLLNGADTVEDALNRINLANVGVWARISEDGSKIDVLNRLSGSDLRIEEFGGSTASSLGIRSMHAGTLLSSLNDGLGIDSVDGTDFRISTAGGATFDIDVNAVDLQNGTLQDVINLINS